MKKAASILTKVFGIITVVSTAISTIVYLVLGARYNSVFFGYAVFYFGWFLLASLFLALATKSIKENKKSVGIGVCNILFCGIVGGIFYLIWNPDDDNPTEAVAKSDASSRIIENEMKQKAAPAPKGNITEELLQLKDLKDMGAISEEEYEQKRKSLIDRP